MPMYFSKRNSCCCACCHRQSCQYFLVGRLCWATQALLPCIWDRTLVHSRQLHDEDDDGHGSVVHRRGQLITAAAMIDDIFSLILLSMLTVVQAESIVLDLLATSTRQRRGDRARVVGFRLVVQCGRLRGTRRSAPSYVTARGAERRKRRCFSSLSELAPWQRGYPRDLLHSSPRDFLGWRLVLHCAACKAEL